MTDEILSSVLNEELNRVLGENEPKIIETLHSVLPEGKQIDADLQKLLITSIRLSSHLSIHLTVRLLEEAGLVRLPAEGVPILRIFPEK